jgi:hypothetical protein
LKRSYIKLPDELPPIGGIWHTPLPRIMPHDFSSIQNELEERLIHAEFATLNRTKRESEETNDGKAKHVQPADC